MSLIPETELWLLEDEEPPPSLEESELLSLLSESESEDSDSEEDSEDDEVRAGFFCSASGFWAMMTLGVFFRCSRSSSLTEIQCVTLACKATLLAKAKILQMILTLNLQDLWRWRSWWRSGYSVGCLEVTVLQRMAAEFWKKKEREKKKHRKRKVKTPIPTYHISYIFN